MRTVTDQVSVAMQKSRLLQEQQTRRRRSEAFHRLLDAGVSSLDVHQSAQRVLASLSAQQDFDLSSVWLLEGDCLELVAQVGYPPEYNRPVPLTAPFDAIDVFKTGCPKIEPRPSNPAVLEFYEKMGIELRAFAIFPLTARDKSVGVLALVWSRDVNLGGQDVVFYQSVADEIAVVLENARLYQSEHHVAETLQETLVVLPAHVPGVAYSRAYRSATLECGRVGGDFVDVFEAGKHLVGISLGDVSGKGLEAAVMTSSIRTTLRVHAIDRKPPATVVTKANEVLRRLTRVEEFVTLWFGLLNTRTGQLRYVCAGHPPALVLSADGSLRELACKDPIVGAFDDVRFRERETVLTRGDRLVLYSDGATEARSESGKFLGEEGLRAHVRDLGSASTIELASALMGDIVAYSAGVLRDDVALLAVEPTKVRTLAHAGQLKAFDADAG